ncbi:MAG TPA: D-glycerate dehydrogenase [Actinomycetota bacterium]|nr:D-glycerate dehydrogenase [Actinomycetota bacterium]
MSERPNVLVTRPIMDEPTRVLRERCDVTIHENDFGIPRDELLTIVKGADAVITMLTERVDEELLEAAGPQLKIVANHAVGFDNVDLTACTAAGVMASNTPDVLTETTADTAWSLLMTAARRIGEGERFLRARRRWIWGPLMMLGQDVHHKTIGIVGFGRIGQALARRASGFGMRVIYHDAVDLPKDVTEPLGAERRELDDLLAEADFISVHVNLTPKTRHLFGAKQFRKMKDTAILVNTSRGPVIDEEALAGALAAGEIFAAGLDVFENEPEVHPGLLELENAVVIPHLGSATVDTRNAMGMLAVKNVFAALDGTRPPTLLNPEMLAGA